MAESLGKRIRDFRKAMNMTQEALAERMNVTAQAVSKWENDVSAPDISVLPDLADIFGITVDELLGAEKPADVRVIPEEKRDLSRLILRISVDSSDGDRVRVNVPILLLKAALDIGISMPQVVTSLGTRPEDIEKIDFSMIFSLIERGVVGKLVEIESADGDRVIITVEPYAD